MRSETVNSAVAILVLTLALLIAIVVLPAKVHRRTAERIADDISRFLNINYPALNGGRLPEYLGAREAEAIARWHAHQGWTNRNEPVEGVSRLSPGQRWRINSTIRRYGDWLTLDTNTGAFHEASNARKAP